MKAHHKRAFNFKTVIRFAVALFVAWSVYCPAAFAETLIIDDGDPGTSSTGSWSVSGGSYPYGDDSLWSKTINGTYSFESVLSGYYEVSLWWTEWSSRCTNVPVKIYDGATLIDTVYVNQLYNAGQWNLLGSYNFQNGSGRVTITSVAGSCSTCADAAQFVSTAAPELDHISIEGPSEVQENSTADYSCRAYYGDGSSQIVDADSWSDNCTYGDIGSNGQLTTSEVESDEQCRITTAYTEGSTENAVLDITITNFVPSSEVIIDDGDSGTSSTGSWSVSGGSYPYGDDSLWSKTINGTYSFESVLSGYYEVSLWWTEWSSRCTNVPVKIYDGATLIDTVYVNQLYNAGQWNLLGSYNFQNGSGRVTITSVAGSCSTCADAVRFVSTAAPELDHISIEGSSEVQENSTADYSCRAYYGDGSSQIVDADSWSDNCTYGDMGSNGQLTTSEVESDEQCRITTAYTEGSTENAVLDITITNFVPSSEVIIDNGNPGTSSTGSWSVSGGSYPYGDDSLWSKTINGTYSFESVLSGYYEVSLWWTEWSSRCTNVPVKIYDGATLIDTVYVNQLYNAGQWNLLGSYNFQNGSGRVTITSVAGSCSTCADAAQFVSTAAPELDHISIEGPSEVQENSTADYSCRAYYGDGSSQIVDADSWSDNCTYGDIGSNGQLTTSEVESDEQCRITGVYTEGSTENAVLDITITNFVPSSEVIIDNGNPGTSSTGTWSVSGAPASYGTESLWSRDGATYTWHADLSGSGVYALYMWWTEWPSRSNNVPITIQIATGSVELYVNQQENGGQWNYIGKFQLDAAEGGTITLNATDAYPVSYCADAVKFVHLPGEKIVDNLSSDFSTEGEWGISTFYPGYYGSDYSFTLAGTSTKSATWTLDISDGIYQMLASWTAGPHRGSNANYVFHNNGIELNTVSRDQTVRFAQFTPLGIHEMEAGTLEVSLNAVESGSVIADALEIIPCCETLPCVKITDPWDGFFQTSPNLRIFAQLFEEQPAGLGIKFRLDGGISQGGQEFLDYNPPFEAYFTDIEPSEHVLEAFVVDAGGDTVAGSSTYDQLNNVGIGEYYVCMGDSITFGEADDISSDNFSRDGRTVSSGYLAVLNDLLGAYWGHPCFFINEGVGATTSADGLSIIQEVLARRPDADRLLVQYGTNDARPWLPVPSGLGLSPGNSGYPGTFKDNVQQIIDAVSNDGREVCLAKAPIALGASFDSQPYPDPDNGLRNVLIKEYNEVVDELVSDPLNDIMIVPPDFYSYFNSVDPQTGELRYENEYSDNLHPNGKGYRSMAEQWFEALNN